MDQGRIDQSCKNVIFRHRIPSSYKDLIPTLIVKQQEAMDRLDVVVPEKKSYAIEACFGRWKELIVELKGREPHFPCSLNRSLFRASMCKDVIRRLKLEWIGQKMAPPLLLNLNSKESINE